MRVIHLVAGAGGLYCGSCLHGNTLAAALLKAGQDVLLVPAYTPLRTDEDDVSLPHTVFGGLNVYLQQRSAVFRHTPWFLDRLLDRPGLLRWVGKLASSTRPEGLGALTVSMLQGEEGRQRKELRKLLRWLQREVRPDLVHLSTALLVGMARPIRQALGVPVVCSLTGEDAFLEQIPEPYYSKARDLLRRHCAELDGLLALSRYYAHFMAEYLPVPRERIRVIAPGLSLAGHADRPRPPGPRKAPVVGYLGRVCPEKGLHLLAAAFVALAANPQVPPLRLRAAGYLAQGDRPYLDRVCAGLARAGLADRFEYAGELDRAGKIAFLQSLDVMSAPALFPESKGLPVLEAWANGVPVVLPDHGAFRELVDDTGAGLLCRPQHVQALADGLRQLILDPLLAADLGRRGHAAVRQRYHAEAMAQQTIQWYKEVLGK